MMRRRPSHISSKRAEAALSMLLTGCTAERLAGFTAAALAGSYNVKIEIVERMLQGARRSRGL